MKRSRSRSDLELQEDLPLHRGDDVDDLVVEPGFIGRRELGLGALAGGGRRADGGRGQQDGDQDLFHPQRVLSRASSVPVAALRI